MPNLQKQEMQYNLSIGNYRKHLNDTSGKWLRYAAIPLAVMEISFIFSDQKMGGGVYHAYYSLYRIIPAMTFLLSGILVAKQWLKKHYSLLWALCNLLTLVGQAFSITVFKNPAPVAYGFTIAVIAAGMMVYYPLYWYYLIVFSSGIACFLTLLSYSVINPIQAQPLIIMVLSTLFFCFLMGAMLWQQRYNLWEQRQITEKQNEILNRYANQINKDLSLAARIQANLLPRINSETKSLFVDYRYIPAGHIAGDMVHVISLNNHKTMLLLTDVSGHGIASALYSMMLQIQSLSRQFDENTHPGQLLEKLNTSLYPGVDGHFVTALICVIDTQLKTAEFANAGHHPAIIINSSTLEYKKIHTPGLPLGVLAEQNYVTVTEPVTENDILFMYSDGCYELDNSESFREGDFLDMIKDCSGNIHHEQCLNYLMQGLQRVSGGKSFSDDISIIVAKIQA